MSRRALLALWAACAVVAHWLPAWVQPVLRADPPAQSPRQLHYKIDARLDAKTRQIKATGTLTWKNPAPVPVGEVWLHLYLNAFKDKRSAFMLESNAAHRGHKFDPTRPGSIELTSFRRKDGPELRGNGTFEPPAHYPHDTTVLRIPLDQPVPSGASVVFDLAWTSQMPRVFARTGYGLGADFFMVAQWYPKPGVFEPVPGGPTEAHPDGWHWNCHAFHGSSEFYADYGTYDVRLTVPDKFAGRIGASGKQQGEPTTGEDGTTTYTFRAEDVHDFAWVAGKDFVVHEVQFEGGAGTDPKEQAHVARILGKEPSDLDLPPVTLHFLLQPEHEDQLDRHVRAVKHAITLMGFWFGPYPYPTLTIVDPDHRGRDAGGMEYPTLITGGTRYIRAARQLSPEGVLVHEFGHQHFYGLIGTNEFESAWMDEGFTTYATARVLMHAYPPSERVTWYAGFPWYGERPLPFSSVPTGSRKAIGLVSMLDEHVKIPFGTWGPIKSLAAKLGVHHPPDHISLWPPEGEVTPLSFLRDVPSLGRWRPRPSSSAERERLWDASNPIVDPIAGRKAWEYMDRRSYGVNSYGRPSNALRTLEGLVGEETMLRILRAYGERYRFQHPKPAQFFELASEVAGKDLQWFFDDVFVHGRSVDYGIGSIETFPVPVVRASKAPKAKEKEKAPDLHRSDVVVRRLGEARLPVEIRVRFEGDTERRFLWERDDTVKALDGGAAPTVVNPNRGAQARWTRLRFIGPKKATLAAVDPHRLLALDRDRSNDGRRTQPHRGASITLALRMLGWVEMTTSFYGGL